MRLALFLLLAVNSVWKINRNYSYMQNQTMDGITHSSGHPTWSSPSLTPSPAYLSNPGAHTLTDSRIPVFSFGVSSPSGPMTIFRRRKPTGVGWSRFVTATQNTEDSFSSQVSEMLWLLLLLTSPPPSSYTSTPSPSSLSYTCTCTHTLSPSFLSYTCTCTHTPPSPPSSPTHAHAHTHTLPLLPLLHMHMHTHTPFPSSFVCTLGIASPPGPTQMRLHEVCADLWLSTLDSTVAYLWWRNLDYSIYTRLCLGQIR